MFILHPLRLLEVPTGLGIQEGVGGGNQHSKMSVQSSTTSNPSVSDGDSYFFLKML